VCEPSISRAHGAGAGGFNRRDSDGIYTITEKRILTHNGHHVRAVASRGVAIDSLRDVPDDLETLVTALLSGSGEHTLRRYYAQLQLGITIDSDTFHNLVNRTKRSLGVPIAGGELKQLLTWLWMQVQANNGVAKFETSTEVENEIDRVFYMSPDMMYNLDRNGCVLIMDSNRPPRSCARPLSDHGVLRLGTAEDEGDCQC
jgi:hypothetical protein